MSRMLRGVAAQRARARACLHRLMPSLEAHVAAVPALEVDALLARVERNFENAFMGLEPLYGQEHDLDELMDSLLRLVVRALAQRPEELRRLDRRREITPDWYLDERMVGYVAYADRFAGSIAGIRDHLDYLDELGVTYLHLMPLLQPRPTPNDGGYAVQDYRRVADRLGTLDDLRQLAADLRGRGMSLCVDLVVNHTAREHAWAKAAIAGDDHYRDYYLTYADREVPDRFEQTLPEVFPDTAPGNYTWVPELQRWVWTTFHDYQWDLDYTNPAVFAEMLDNMLFLANRGVEILRLDAVPFMWKREGTDCQNQPEVHAILQAWRALVAMATSSVLFKGEAIVPSDQLVQYLGASAHDRAVERRECELAYNNQLMVQLWSSLASRDTRLMTQALGRMRRPPSVATWVTYVRCHDDIGWAIGDEDAVSVGVDPRAHRRFLADFYAGDFPLSFARGERFQVNEETGDARSSGMAASLCGIEAALDAGADPANVDVEDLAPDHPDALLDQAIRRLVLLYSVAMSYGGIPLLWMGDEIAMRNDLTFRDAPAHAADNRWMHRPLMDWEAAKRRREHGTLEARVFGAIRDLAEARRSIPALRSGAVVKPLATDDHRIFAFARHHPQAGRFLGIANFGDTAASCWDGLIEVAGLNDPYDVRADDGSFGRRDGRIHVERLGMLWLADGE